MQRFCAQALRGLNLPEAAGEEEIEDLAVVQAERGPEEGDLLAEDAALAGADLAVCREEGEPGQQMIVRLTRLAASPGLARQVIAI